MRLGWRMFATMAVAFLLVPALRADDTPKLGSTAKAVTTTNKDEAVNSRVASGAAGEATPAAVTTTNKDEAVNSGAAPGAAGEATPNAPTPAPVPPSMWRGGNSNTPKVELFAGYSFWRAMPTNVNNRIAWLHGGNASVAFNLNNWLGLVADFGGYAADRFGPGAPPTGGVLDADGRVFTYMAGPRLSYRKSEWVTPFAQVLFGGAHATEVKLSGCTGVGCTPLSSENAFAMTAGGGVDLKLRRHIAIRLFQAEYLMTRFADASPFTGERVRQNNLRLSAGLVFRFGSMGPPPVSPSAACSLQPTEVFAGEPVTATASGSNFNPKRSVTYGWNGTGVKVAGSDASTQIDTTGLQPGSYGVTANLSDGSKNGFAACSARFTVKEPHPPVISCSADPASVRMGGTSTINSNASSPDGRRLAYSYSASAGEISGNGSTATLNTQGAQPGRITVTCNVSDDRNPPLTASSTTTVNVEAPPPPPPQIKQLEARLALHSIYFQTARPTADNPNGGLVDSQAEILKTLAEDFKNYLKYRPDAHLIIGGHADPRGSVEYNKGLTERRVERTKNTLMEHGVPADHIDTRSFGKEDQLTADQVKQQIADNPDLSPDDRQQMLNNLRVMVLANNRRVDVTLSTTGQESTRRFPFNAKDYLALISTKGGEKKAPVKPRVKPPAKKKP
jgi:outer membrane protein OmpA-like peptidoglycan-associated protein/opacity protein-like surface antigen